MEEAPPDVVTEETVSVLIWLHELSFKHLSTIYHSCFVQIDWGDLGDGADTKEVNFGISVEDGVDFGISLESGTEVRALNI